MKSWKPTKEAYKLFHDASIALSQIEANGIRVDTKYLNSAIFTTTATIKELELDLKLDPIFRTWKKRFGEKTKLSAPQQLATVIFEEMGYNGDRRTDKGNRAADEAAFADVDLPFVKTWFKIQKLRKALGTYLTGIAREVVDGYIHPNFNLNLVATYRSSSDNPNFQNIPVRNPTMAEIIRRCYISREGQALGEIDFSGAEVRVSACYNKDPVLIKYLIDPHSDMHSDTACDVYLLKKDQVDKKGPRDACKNMFVFPQFYGSVWFQCAPDLWNAMIHRKFTLKDSDVLVQDHLAKKGITRLGRCEPGSDPEEGTFAQLVYNAERSMWDKRFKVYSEWKRRWWGEYQRTGGFQMYTGFTCWGVFSRNDVLNYAVQGSAFHCLLWSLVQVQKWLRKNKMLTKIVGQIHDSMVVDIHPNEQAEFLGKCKEVMTVDLLKHWDWLIVPMAIEAEVSPINGNWFEKKGVPIS